jgi:hypothetical protein
LACVGCCWKDETARDVIVDGVSWCTSLCHAQCVAGLACYFRSIVPRMSDAWPGQVQKKA